MVNPQAMDLAFVLRNIPGYEHDMGSYGGRQRLQRLVYMLQAFGVNIGYDYNWYLAGPYDTLLMACAYVLEKFWRHVPAEPVRFKGSVAQERWLRFLAFVSRDGARRLGLAVALHYRVHMKGDCPDAARAAAARMNPGAGAAEVRALWDEMRELGLFDAKRNWLLTR